MKTSLLTNELIVAGLQFQPTYKNGISNHLPMTLVALDQIGTNDECVLLFYHQYITQLENVARNEPFLKQANEIEQRIKNDGVETTLIAYMPRLIASFNTQAFQCMIRLSYAIKSQQQREIAYALAYWDQSYQLITPLSLTEKYNAEQQLKQLTYAFSNSSFEANNISQRIFEVAQSPNYLKLAPVPVDITIEKVLQLVVEYYRKTNNSTLLHGITALHAFIELLQYFQDQQTALQWFWQSYTAAFATVGKNLQQPRDVLPTPPHLSWLETITRGALSKNDHTITLIYSCSELYKRYPLAELKYIANQCIANENL
ncbi:hypothetical protein UB33_11760 [Photobacterium angustum]|uniref:questin oxidase family protein n=1 Tax=Photobacterium angustum TaxID=661 RepID=UPI0005E7788F|nr:questin oxidase family protein [Photobacterium angustum]KJF94080.1 hypothetical protein UB39_12835 [Photobacterium angustum]KJG06019.1 hypothetical protein UB33_11760 [Photobacterium angustum]PSV92480.1 DUF4243 domain-containing protein [Photobacterium angustum]PSW76332.1 DUF4243 domain-containing protein [Photobacterium angustum]